MRGPGTVALTALLAACALLLQGCTELQTSCTVFNGGDRTCAIVSYIGRGYPARALIACSPVGGEKGPPRVSLAAGRKTWSSRRSARGVAVIDTGEHVDKHALWEDGSSEVCEFSHVDCPAHFVVDEKGEFQNFRCVQSRFGPDYGMCAAAAGRGLSAACVRDDDDDVDDPNVASRKARAGTPTPLESLLMLAPRMGDFGSRRKRLREAP